jgi:hypothetical protein
MKLFGSEGLLLMEVDAITPSGREIVIKGRMMGQIPMMVVVGPSELRQTFGLLSIRLIFQAVRMLFLRGRTRKS